jgi:hypothetical protein
MIRNPILHAFSLAATVSLSAAVPPWVLEVAKTPTPKLPPEVGAHVLLDELRVDIGADGKAVFNRRYVTRILNQSGDEAASVAAYYDEKADRLGEGAAWLVRGGKAIKEEPLRKWLDVCLISDGAVFTEQRSRMLSFAREALVNDVFAAEYRVTRPLLFAQMRFDFSWGVPIACQRYQVRVPPGWSLTSLQEGNQKPTSASFPEQHTWVWEMTGIPFVPAEEWAPRLNPDTPRMFLTFVPPTGAKAPPVERFQSWADVGVWNEKLSAGQRDTDELMRSVVERLTSATGDAMSTLREVCGHVQRLRYVAVDRNLGMGFGYRPRRATEVLSRGYGDCKDKANLLCAMLQLAGIRAHLVAVRAGDHHPVNEQWPSPLQFDHAIVAIEVDSTIDLPAVTSTPAGQRLLIFDPTDDCTVLGDLPWNIQGTKGFIKLGAESTLIDIPTLPGEQKWLFLTRGKVAIGSAGTAVGSVEFSGRRQAGGRARRVLRDLSAKELSDAAVRYMSAMLRGVLVRNIGYRDEPASGDAVLSFELAAPAVFQAGPGGMTLMRLDVFNRDTVPQLGTRERSQPIEVRPVIDDEEVSFFLPPGFAIEDIPAPVKKTSTYGSFERAIEVRDGSEIVLRRRLQLKAQILPAADYAKLRAFLTEAARADKAAVVLRRKE